MDGEQQRIEAVYRRRDTAYRAGKYALDHPGELYMLQRREEETLALLRRAGLSDLRTAKILDVGCGRGLRLLDWLRWGAAGENLAGLDLVPAYVAAAAALLPAARLTVGAADTLPFADGQFDLVVQAMMMTSLLDPACRRMAAAEMRRVLKPGGAILWYDFRYRDPRNADVRAIGRRAVAALFPGCAIAFVSLTLLPPVARRLARRSFTACRLAERLLPPARSHWLALIREAEQS